MKKTYISPNTMLIMMQQSSMICSSVPGFRGGLDDTDPVNGDKILSRRGYDGWDDEEDEEEDE